MNSARSRPDRDDARVARVPIDRLRVHPRNVRHDLGDLRELAASIAADGILVPLMAERRGDVLRILHGHRRAAAAEQAGLRTVPCVVVPEHTDEQAIVLMLAENTRRQGLTPAEKRDAVTVLHEQHGYSIAEIAERLGVSAGTIYAWRRETAPIDDDAPTPHGSPADEHADGIDDVAVDAVVSGRLHPDQVTPAEVKAAVVLLSQRDLGVPAIAERLGIDERRVQRARAAAGIAGEKPARLARPKGQHRRVVSAGKVRDLAERWQGHAPPMLLRELRQLAGESPAPASIADRRQAGEGA